MICAAVAALLGTMTRSFAPFFLPHCARTLERKLGSLRAFSTSGSTTAKNRSSIDSCIWTNPHRTWTKIPKTAEINANQKTGI
jgi:hypothetical protein